MLSSGETAPQRAGLYREDPRSSRSETHLLGVKRSPGEGVAQAEASPGLDFFLFCVKSTDQTPSLKRLVDSLVNRDFPERGRDFRVPLRTLLILTSGKCWWPDTSVHLHKEARMQKWAPLSCTSTWSPVL